MNVNTVYVTVVIFEESLFPTPLESPPVTHRYVYFETNWKILVW
jgi:hypothetical protein